MWAHDGTHLLARSLLPSLAGLWEKFEFFEVPYEKRCYSMGLSE
jgi:hypothetical protein